jgi:3-oxoacyl-[acyl-carrier protein] reductase
MLKAHGGRIINIASVAGLVGNPGQANYSASKAGVIGLTRTVARELAGRGITVNAVAPGFIATEMTAGLGEEVLAEVKKQTPLARLGEPQDIADAVLFLASDGASFITGHVLTVDGGLSI